MLGKYVTFDSNYCTGCTSCVRACPTKAIRVRDRKAYHVSDLCIGCGECIRVCPEGAVSATNSSRLPTGPDKFEVAIVSPILYAQFPGVTPSDVMLALRRCGFSHVIDLSYYLEMYQFAVEEFIRQNLKTREAPWPLISPICPVITRLIALQYPNLLPHIVPLKRPVALIGGDFRARLSTRYGIELSRIELCHITPCPSKTVSRDAWLFNEIADIDRAIGINDIYPELSRHLEDIRDRDLDLSAPDRFNSLPNARGLMWGMSGGEIADLRIDCVLGVSGLKESIAYIEKIEMGLFRDMRYIELRGCPEGCLGGPLTAVDRYVAKSYAQQMIRLFGVNRRLPRGKIRRLYEKGLLFSETRPSELAIEFEHLRPRMTLKHLQRIEKLLARIAGNDCAACGAPDCRTFAEDVVCRGVDPAQCFRLREAQGER